MFLRVIWEYLNEASAGNIFFVIKLFSNPFRVALSLESLLQGIYSALASSDTLEFSMYRAN